MTSPTDLLHRSDVSLEAHSADAVLTVQEVARYLRVPVSTVYKLTRLKDLPGLKVGKHWRFSRRDVEAWIACRRGHEPAPPEAA